MFIAKCVILVHASSAITQEIICEFKSVIWSFHDPRFMNLDDLMPCCEFDDYVLLLQKTVSLVTTCHLFYL